MDKLKKSYYAQVAESLIMQLKQGTAPWQKPWQAGDPLLSFPHNPTTGKRYRGINALYLMSKRRIDPRWMTYKQAANMGAQVRKGEKSTTIQYWKFTEEHIKKDDHNHPVSDSNGRPIKVCVKLERPRVFYAFVFNAEQIDNLPELIIDTPQWNPIERAEQILQVSSAVIQHGEYDRAFYRPATDKIHLPHKYQFETSDRYYATALHELGHWTGHESRLNRDLAHPFGSEGYAREELRAEIASMLLGYELGIGHDPGQHAAYVASWIKGLEADPVEIFRAAADAEKIQEYVLAFVQQQDIVEQEGIRMERIKQDITTYTASLTPDLATVAQHNQQYLQKLLENFTAKDRDAIYLVADALKFYRNFSIDNLEFEETSKRKLGFTIPAEWMGPTHVESNTIETREKDVNPAVATKKREIDPEFWVVYAQLNNQTWVWVEDFEVKLHAHHVVEKFALVDAVAEQNEYEKMVKFTRIYELRIRDDPRSTQEAILAAKEQRKQAEALAMQHDAALEKRWQDKASRQTDHSEPQQAVRQTTNDRSAKNNFRQYLVVPYQDKDQARSAGARWDKAAKAWYVGDRADIRALQRWLPENVAVQQNPAMDAQTEFANLLRANGFIVDGSHPIMDGSKQRIKVEGDKPGEKSGFYVGYLDSYPTGYFKNHRTKAEERWSAKGYSLTNEQKAAFTAQIAIRQQERKAEQHAQYVKVSEAIQALLTVAPAASANHPYLQDKGIGPGALKRVPDSADGLPENTVIKICHDRQEVKSVREQHLGSLVFVAGDLLIPLYDVEGNIWSAQTIQANGTKFFAAGSHKEGHFYVVGGDNSGLQTLDSAEVIIIAEGYATADTISQALNCPVVAAFDSGNLYSVAQQLHDKYTNKPMVIAGDDDQHLVALNGKNTGKEKAMEAADLVSGTTVFPTFAPGEQALHKLSDFNDLAYKSTLGPDAVKRQVGAGIAKAIKQVKLQKHQDQTKQQAAKTQKRTFAR